MDFSLLSGLFFRSNDYVGDSLVESRQSRDHEFSVKPDEPKLYLFSKILQFTPEALRNLLWLSLIGISPEIPASLGTLFNRRNARRAGLAGALMTFIACFVVIAIWCWLSGSLRGNDPGRLYFLQDHANILNYVIVCPLYVGFSCALITNVIGSWAQLAEFGGQPASHEHRHFSVGLAIFIATILAGISTSNYIAECLNPGIYPMTSWYVEQVIQGHRLLGALGIYYAVINFTLLVVIILAAFAFFSIFTVSIRAGQRLNEWNPAQPISFDQVSNSLASFTESYLVSKLLVATLMLNAFTFKWARPHHSINFWLFGAAITFFGVFFVSFPRYYVELQWLKLKFRMAHEDANSKLLHYDDLRPLRTKLIVYILDVLIISGFIASFWVE